MSAQLTGKVFAGAIGKVAGFTLKPGVLLEGMDPGLRLVAMESYRLTVVELGGALGLKPGRRLLVAGDSLRNMAPMLRAAGGDPVMFAVDGERLRVSCGYRAGTVGLLDAGTFPAYEKVIPGSWVGRAIVQKAPLLRVVRKLQYVYGYQSVLQLKFAPDGLGLVTCPFVGPDFVGCKVEGEPVTVYLRLDFLRDGLQVAGGRSVVLSAVDGRQPVAIRSVSDPGFLYVIAQRRRPFGVGA
jgi:DNA polymerase-3 subunit beta